jgi:hypothetical protein
MRGTFSVVAEVWNGDTAQKSPARGAGLGKGDGVEEFSKE